MRGRRSEWERRRRFAKYAAMAMACAEKFSERSKATLITHSQWYCAWRGAMDEFESCCYDRETGAIVDMGFFDIQYGVLLGCRTWLRAALSRAFRVLFGFNRAACAPPVV